MYENNVITRSTDSIPNNTLFNDNRIEVYSSYVRLNYCSPDDLVMAANRLAVGAVMRLASCRTAGRRKAATARRTTLPLNYCLYSIILFCSYISALVRRAHGLQLPSLLVVKPLVK